MAKTRQWALAVLVALLCGTGIGFAQYEYPFQNPALSIDQRVDNIVSLMTLEEKIAIVGTRAVPRLKIPSPGSAEGIHQVERRALPNPTADIPTTSFSQVYGMGETWDPELIRRAGAVEAYEARYITQSDKYKRPILVLQGPTSDLARDPRWGRNDESFGEDPFLTGTMAVAYVKGIQGDDPKYWEAGSLLKHFMANSNETTRGGSSSNFDERLMREYYSVPFRMAFLEGGAKSYMPAYNAWNGIPMTVNPMLKDVVAKEWGANWIVSSDSGAMGHVINFHKYLKTPEEVVAAAVKLGLNQFTGGGDGGAAPAIIQGALDQKLMTEADLSEAIKGKLKTAVKLGLLDPPAMVPYTKIGAAGETEPWNGEKHKGVARQVARESVVLLKNTGLLPMNKQAVKSIAVVGNRAEEVLFDNYSGTTPYAISVLEGIKEKVGGGIKVNYAAEGEAAVNAAKASDIAVVVVGNHPICGGREQGMFNRDASSKPCAIPSEGREGRDREAIDLPTEELIEQVYAANPKTIVVLIASFPYAINWSQENVPAILHITHTAQEQGTAIADVLFGDYNPAGRLVQTWPKSLDQVPPIMDYDLRHGRTYLYFKGQPLYPFGYGLSYTKFDYSNLRLSSAKLAKDGAITASVDVKNTGKLAGDEVVQMYVEHPKSQVARPLKELKGFQRITLKPGEKKTVRMALKAQSLAWWNEKQKAWEVEAEPIGIQIGSSSADIRLKKDATVD